MITLEMLRKATADWLGLAIYDEIKGPKEFTVRFKFTSTVAGANQLAVVAKQLFLSKIKGIFVGEQFVYDTDTKKVRMLGIFKIKRDLDESIVIPTLRRATLEEYPVGSRLEVSVSTKGRSKRVSASRVTKENISE